MTDLLLSALVPNVLNKATDSLVQRIGEMWGINDQRERLHDMLLKIQAVLPDAEVKANSNVAVKSWLEKLKSAAYDADDLLDEFCYKKLHKDAVRRGHKGGNVSDFFSLDNPALFRYKMSRKLKNVVGRIDGLIVQMGRFDFVHDQSLLVANRVRTDSVLVESKVLGREKDKEKIVKLLLEGSDNADLTVVSVIGMGGVGKTTLAQLVYNDARIKEHFKLPLWVCVSQEFDMGLLVKSIVDLIKGDCSVPVDNMELLQRRLCQVLGGKRYLLVLDDVWNENVEMWKRLRAYLNFGDSGSAIIVTTRSDKVASIMGTVESYNLRCLDDEDSWNLFDKRAFKKGVKKCQELVEIGHKLVQNCGGLPLAINTLGSVMSYKHEVKEWLAILEESDMWLKIPTKDEVLPVLRLSYEQLPIHMKQCFAFCAVFPKGHVMDKEKLIQYWMANGFISSDGIGNLEINGNDTFNELAWRSFFQDVKQVSDDHLVPPGREDGHWFKTTCKMHDLMHDLARSIVGDECLSLLELPAQLTQPIRTVRHILMRTALLDINTTINCYPSVQSLIFNCRQNFRSYVQSIEFLKSNALRILNLDIIKPIEKTILTPEKMRHLRYLEIGDADIKLLPESISTLYFLQTLRLSWCVRLEKLPDSMQYMSNLRHLYIEHCCTLKRMPSCLGQLRSLQTLTNYIIGADVRNGIGELENLNLHGQLHLYNLSEVKDGGDASKAKLITKQNLEKLMLCWGRRSYSLDHEVPISNSTDCNHFEVLDALRPCNKLKVLQIILYRGDKFPVWVTEYEVLENLVELYLIECRVCTKIPQVEKLPFLRVLGLKRLDKVRHLCSGASTIIEGGENAQIFFPSLKELQLSEMPNLRSWWEGEARDETSMVFTQLKTLGILNCPVLSAMPIVPLLEKLSVKGNKTLSCLGIRLTTLQELKLVNHGRSREAENASEYLSFKPWESLKELHLDGYNSIVPVGANEGEGLNITVTQCRMLDLRSCNFDWSHIPSNASLWFWKCFTFLQHLWIKNCDSLIYWPEEEFRSLNNLTFILVRVCQNFLGTRLELPVGKPITEVLLPKLRQIYIDVCPNLVEIPKFSASVKYLNISNCSKLQCLPEWLGSMVALKLLDIHSCKNLNSLPLSIGNLSSLEHLRIAKCPKIAYLPEEVGSLKALQSLHIITCPKIRILPDGLLQQLTNFHQLCITGCPNLERHFRKLRKYRHLSSKILLKKIGGKDIWEEPAFLN